MDARDWFSPSVVGWFADQPDNIMDAIADISEIPRDDMFRPAQVYDETIRDVIPTAAQRLFRWSTEKPRRIFRQGFRPRVIPENNTFPRRAFNLREYVDSATASIFIGTTRPYRNTDNKLVRWGPPPSPANQDLFLYEILAYGGIDVNQVLGTHRYERQMEIAFPGGIHRTMIRSARQYRRSRLVRIWNNTRFSTAANPPAHTPLDIELPRMLRNPTHVPVQDHPPIEG